jgi:hypothetical protein
MPDRYMVADVVKGLYRCGQNRRKADKIDGEWTETRPKTGKYLKTRNPNVKRGASQTHATWLAYKIS